MKVLVIGSGGREHAICRQFAQSSNIEKIYCAPGNGGIASVAQNTNIGVSEFEKLATFVKENNIDLTFVGPEVPLSEGIVDFFEAEGLKIAGPSKAAARLEASKTYSKEFMQKYNVPTAKYESFSNIDDALKYLENWEENKKVVVKADGLAAGKGVYMCNGRVDAINAVKQIMSEKVLGAAGATVVIEEFINGQELSYLIFTDGVSYAMMPASQDHKRVNDNDEGLNTGGMGAYAPAPLATENLNKKVETNIIQKVIKGIRNEKLNYKGVLYVGVIMNGQEPYVLEFNCRFGDPETQAVLPLLKTNLTDICEALLNKKLSDIKIEWKKEFAVCVVLASGGYPGSFQKGFEIKGLESITDKDTIIFHAGTKVENGKAVTSGGRVLGVTSTAADIKSAIDKVYSQVKLISFENMHYRKDIAHKAIRS
ncbi:phosphoribosylamine--glycine ligase [Endomicrobium proavitum]|uniref:Phosphoribosylamine--glycine ligase n=1 Tax=Endomicrobium proavitum TaxID=1408281 RepID=A0A0G3WI99_9BACT|nr:phosphoribosylamine--glycine ligase [Endomicrobium proavitum]AKL98018.1 Phosphoribosylamine--glycine ligase [Endomicrobium proavitum]